MGGRSVQESRGSGGVVGPGVTKTGPENKHSEARMTTMVTASISGCGLVDCPSWVWFFYMVPRRTETTYRRGRNMISKTKQVKDKRS